MKIKGLVLSLLAALVAVPSFAFANQIDLSVDQMTKADAKAQSVTDSLQNGAKVRFHGDGMVDIKVKTLGVTVKSDADHKVKFSAAADAGSGGTDEERKEEPGKRSEHLDRGRKLGHAFQELSVEVRADLKAQLKVLHEEFRAKLQALREEFAAKVKALIDAFLEVEAESSTEAEVEANGS